MTREVTDNVYWVGSNTGVSSADSASSGSISDGDVYLLIDKTTTLINIPADSQTEQILDNICDIVDASMIGIIIANHTDATHSAGLSAILRLCPDARVVVSAKAIDDSFAISAADLKPVPVTTGDQLLTGEHELTFVDGPMPGFSDKLFTVIRRMA